MTDKELENAIIRARREYQREWRKRNPDKVRKHQSNFWKKRAAQAAGQGGAAGK